MSEFPILEKILSHCESRGAQAAVKLRRGEEWSTNVSNAAVELHEAASSQGLSIECFLDDGRHASVSTSDFTPATIMRLADEAVDLAQAGAADEWEGLADAADCGLSEVSNLDDGGADFNEEQAVQLILDAEAAAKKMDKRIIATHRSGISMNRGTTWFACSNGIRQQRQGSSYRAQLIVVAEDQGEKQMGYEWSANRSFRLLRDAESLARKAVDKAVAGYNWKQAPTGSVSVVFNNEVASQIIGLTAHLANGSAIYRGRSCWGEMLGQAVASPCVQITDDPLIDGALGSRPADSDGVKSRRCSLIKDGVLQCFLTSAYSARRLGQPLTGHANGSSNLILEAGEQNEEALFKQMGSGMYVTGLQGHGIDLSSGHWSKGAEGFWIENGERAYPVQNVTLAGNLKDMFKNIQAIADNPLQESSTSSPSLLISEMQLGGSS